MSELLLILFGLAFVACAMYGFVALVAKLFSAGKSKDVVQQTGRTLKDDVIASAMLLNHLRIQKQIDQQQYRQLRDFIEKQFGTRFELPQRLLPPPVQAAPRSSVVQDVPAEEQIDDEIVLGEVVEQKATPIQVGPNGDTKSSIALSKTPQPSVEAKIVKAPWDVPDSLPPVPKRTLSDVLAAFMLEKNIRWGELASGILIVGSAVGLVVSLRNELNDTIPYFPALMFLLITASIHAAGSYTLKKWKLRKTSRGTLLIGLLLIPLNFLAACVLTGSQQLRKPLDDPMYWVAVITGVVCFGFMTWWSSRLLFRRGNLAITLCMMGAAVLTLVINRLEFLGSTSWTALVAAGAVAVCAVTGSSVLIPAFWRKTDLSSRIVNRQFMLLGLSVFAFAAAVSLILIRAIDRPNALVAMSPAITAVLMLIAGLGATIHARARGRESNSQKIVGQALLILGLISSAASMLVSTSNPTMLFVNGMVAAVALWVIYEKQNLPFLIPAAWASLSVSVLSGVNLAAGTFQIDSWAGLDELRKAFVSGKSGLSLLALGAGVTGLSMVLSKTHVLSTSSLTETRTDQKNRLNQLSAGSIAGFGCLLALAAGLLNRSSVFDTMTASALMLVASIVLLILSLRSRIDGLPTVASLNLLICLAFSFLWNPTISAWVQPLTHGLKTHWILVFAGPALIVGFSAALSARLVRGDHVSSTTREFGICAAAAAGIATFGCLMFANSGTGFSTINICLMLFAWLCIAWSYRNSAGNEINFSISFALMTGLLPAMFLFEFGPNLGLPPNTDVAHWLIQFILLAVWSTAWSLSAVVFARSKSVGWAINNQQIRGDQIVLAVVVLAIMVVVGLRLFESVGRELDVSFDSRLTPITSILTLAGWSIVASLAAVIASLFKRADVLKGGAVVFLFILAWTLGAAPFDATFSVGSAVRWLLPIGAIVASAFSFLFVPLEKSWNSARRSIGLEDADQRRGNFGLNLAIDQNGKQLLINLFLTVSVIIVLAISSLATAQVLVSEAGAKSLGGPMAASWFGNLRAEINYGVPGVALTTAILLFAISQRRSGLAMAGSCVYQYVVLFSIAMLFLSRHPAIATQRFVETLQAVSLGMSGYGFIWFWQRNRIGKTVQVSVTRNLKISQIELHTLINSLLVTSLAVLIGFRFFVRPDLAGGWVNAAGGPLGMIALVGVVALSYFVWRDRVTAESNANLVGWLFCWTGLVLTAMVAAIADRATGGGAWVGLRVIIWGSLLVSGGLIAIAGFFSRRSNHTVSALPVLSASLVTLLFAMRGGWADSSAFVQYILATGLVVLLTSLIGFVARSAWPSVASAVSMLLGAVTLTWIDPARMFNNGPIDSINVAVLGLVMVSLVWTGFYIWRRARNEDLSVKFVILPNTILLASAIWVLMGSLLEWFVQTEPRVFGGGNVLAYPWGVAAIIASAVLAGVHAWNDRNRFQVVSRCLWSVGVTIVVVAVIASDVIVRNIWIMFTVGLVVAMWGIVWSNRDRYFKFAETIKIPRLGNLQIAMRIQLPIYSLIVGSILLLASFFAILLTEARPLRYLTAMTPFALAVGIGCLSDQDRRRWMQFLSLVLVTIGCVFTAWADLSPTTIGQSSIQLAVRTLLVLAGAMFVYGALVSRWVREGDSWLRSLREMTVATCAAALLCLGFVVLLEANRFVENVGCGLSVTESVAATAVITGMIVGLVIIAVRPENDPFSLPLAGRMGYVYAAQVVAVLLVCHLYFTMPWLFQLGIEQYWPYIAIALTFGGVGVAQVLEKRNLTVLGQPLFHTAAVLPVLVSALIWAVDSEADNSLVLLTAGLAYLLISYTHHSLLSGAAAVVLGNLALWVFYGKFPSFSFFDHPQLWLIPPAISVLVAGHLASKTLTKGQLAMLRYLCVAVIYISSTSEIFISGIGDKLWPPIVLAVLSVVGILLGMALQVRAYLFLGALFLLMAMITMVSHAHQRLDHVWPWWAFGIGMGVAILVMFGLFESRKSKMKALAGKLQQWDL